MFVVYVADVDRFARVVLGFHGCNANLARELLGSDDPIGSWRPSENDHDWLGRGIYFWEHAPERALEGRSRDTAPSRP